MFYLFLLLSTIVHLHKAGWVLVLVPPYRWWILSAHTHTAKQIQPLLEEDLRFFCPDLNTGHHHHRIRRESGWRNAATHSRQREEPCGQRQLLQCGSKQLVNFLKETIIKVFRPLKKMLKSVETLM